MRRKDSQLDCGHARYQNARKSRRRMGHSGEETSVSGQSDIESLRSAIVENALWGVTNKVRIHYAQTRPIQGIGRPRRLPLSTDCSGFVTLCYNWAKAPDPNGNGYNGYGYTGTILQHCLSITRSAARPGDLVVFGGGSGDHVVVIVGTGANPAVVSHGQEAGPLRTSLEDQIRSHRPPVRFRRARGLFVRFAVESGDDYKIPVDLADVTNPPTE